MLEHSGLLTDLYELTMAAGYLQTGFDARATFELFVRHLPAKRNYLVTAGLEQALEFLEQVHFTKDEISYLLRHPIFPISAMNSSTTLRDSASPATFGPCPKDHSYSPANLCSVSSRPSSRARLWKPICSRR